jgi:hypothetical protein
MNKISDWFSTLTAGSELPIDAGAELQERGFVVIPGTVASDRVEPLAIQRRRSVRDRR